LPSVAKITAISSVYPLQTQTIVISGTGFGSHGPFNGDLPCIQFEDVTADWRAGHVDPLGQPNSGGSCSSPQASAGDSITLDISNWTDGRITIIGFTGEYGNREYGGRPLATGDQLYVQVWNAQIGFGYGQATSVL
jgi:hypothetical protein